MPPALNGRRLPSDLQALDDAALVEHIVERFHDAHRRDLPPLLAAARAVEAALPAGSPVVAGLADELAAFGAALEAHMFKEEMRLFPMLEQGGSALVGHLIDDMEAEHRRHEAEVERLDARIAAVAAGSTGATAAGANLRACWQRLTEDLRAHIALEDDSLFARWAGLGRDRR